MLTTGGKRLDAPAAALVEACGQVTIDCMQVRVEFLGLARHRAGRSDLELVLEGPRTSLARVLRELTQRLPALGQDLLAGDNLSAHWTVCLDGARFVRDPATPIGDGACLWLMSADAGG